MAIEQKSVAYAKEIGDVMVLAVGLVAGIKAGKQIQQLAAEELPALMTAISGVDQAPAEVKADLKAALSTVGFHTGELAAILIS